MRWYPIALALAACAALSACAGRHRMAGEHEQDFHPPIEILLRYDANHDGTVTRAEMEAGLRADFAAADTNHDGHLDEDETRAVNQKRWSENASTASPLVDWNHDGVVDFDEFAATARSLFDEMDKDGDGKLTPKELHPYGPAAKPDDQQDEDQGEQHHRHRGGDGD